VLAGYVATGRSSRMQLAYAEMNENAQIGLTLLARDLQMAGYARPTGVVSDAAGTGQALAMRRSHAERPVFGCAHGLASSSSRNRAAPWDAAVCAPASGESDHVIEIVYEADLVNSSPTAAAVPSDCIGSGLSVSETTLGGGG
ncbi:PilW family protein, partial [Leptospira sp. SA-E8]|uniref:PilW family protein n=1 Tax=Leptospira sp. SA-E8 TaxID=3422259 RepID=UPI003EB8AB83